MFAALTESQLRERQKAGFPRVHCDACAHEYLLAFLCKARYFCPSCHAKRLALLTLWLEETLLAPDPHRQVVLTIPKRLRTWCLYRIALLGDLACVPGVCMVLYPRGKVQLNCMVRMRQRMNQSGGKLSINLTLCPPDAPIECEKTHVDGTK
ncbi:MAG: transposase zinc-binding domain-containing protein [Gemmatimonadaceae bacterium]